MSSEDEHTRTDLSPEAERIVLLYSVLAGLCKLIPIPFLDDIAMGLVARRMAWLLLSRQGLSPSSAQLGHLTRERQGCPLGCVYGLLWKPLKKMFRTILFFFAFRDCVAASARWFHRGYLLAVAVHQGHLRADTLAEEAGVWPVALAVEEALLETNTNPVDVLFDQVLRGSRTLLRRISRDLLRLVWRSRAQGDTPEQQQALAVEALAEVAPQEEAALEAQLARLADLLWAQEGYLRDLDARFARALAQTRARFPADPPDDDDVATPSPTGSSDDVATPSPTGSSDGEA